MPTNTEITPDVIEQVVNLANQFTLHDNPRSGFYQFIPGVLATTLYVHIADYGRRYDYGQMMAILELAEPQIRLSTRIMAGIRSEWITLGVYRDVMRGAPHPRKVELTNAYLSGQPVVPEIQRIFKEVEG